MYEKVKKKQSGGYRISDDMKNDMREINEYLKKLKTTAEIGGNPEKYIRMIKEIVKKYIGENL